MTITELVDFYRSEGYADVEIDRQIPHDLEEQQRAFIEEYENDPFVHEGWTQQDVIDSYRLER